MLESAERAEKDLKYRRRSLLWIAALYTIGAIVGTTEVVLGNAPLLSMVGLPISGGFIWLFLREASRIKNPTK